MRRRVEGVRGVTPLRLWRYDPAEWDGPQEWWDARKQWEAEHGEAPEEQPGHVGPDVPFDPADL